MKLYLQGHDERYALEQLQLALFPEEAMEAAENAAFSGDGAVSALHRGDTWLTASARITWRGRSARAACRLRRDRETVPLRRRILQRSYYLAAIRLLPEKPPWGALAGVRPTKLSTRCLLQGGSEAQADRLMRDIYFVLPERRRLCIDASRATVRAAKLLRDGDVSVYVGIPFCPSRCSYCSFVSQSIERCAGLLEQYLDCLLREIQHVGERMKAEGFGVSTLYIGGGTPTTLNAGQLERLMAALQESLDLSGRMEYTVEAGRPDTLDPEKLRVLREYGADRVSINPQSMNDRVLEAVGRRHSASDALRAYSQAREAGFAAINMDLIAGLQGDDPDSFVSSLNQIIALAPENITVHTLALKKGADLFQDRGELPDAQSVARMLREGEALLRGVGYVPYYLYRQKYMSGSFENVGWTKPGFDGLYNIYMMEELQSILALGGGGMTKIMLPGGRLERQHNPKAPQQYIARIDETLTQKDAVLERLKGSIHGKP